MSSFSTTSSFLLRDVSLDTTHTGMNLERERELCPADYFPITIVKKDLAWSNNNNLKALSAPKWTNLLKGKTTNIYQMPLLP